MGRVPGLVPASFPRPPPPSLPSLCGRGERGRGGARVSRGGRSCAAVALCRSLPPGKGGGGEGRPLVGAAAHPSSSQSPLPRPLRLSPPPGRWPSAGAVTNTISWTGDTACKGWMGAGWAARAGAAGAARAAAAAAAARLAIPVALPAVTPNALPRPSPPAPTLARRDQPGGVVGGAVGGGSCGRGATPPPRAPSPRCPCAPVTSLTLRGGGGGRGQGGQGGRVGLRAGGRAQRRSRPARPRGSTSEARPSASG